MGCCAVPAETRKVMITYAGNTYQRIFAMPKKKVVAAAFLHEKKGGCCLPSEHSEDYEFFMKQVAELFNYQIPKGTSLYWLAPPGISLTAGLLGKGKGARDHSFILITINTDADLTVACHQVGHRVLKLVVASSV